MGDLVERANMILNGEQVKVSVDVHASFKAGSFGIDMELAQSLWQKVLDLTSGQSVVGIATICSLLGFSVRDSCKGVIQVIKWLRGRGVTRIEPLESGVVRLFVGDEHMDTEERVLKAGSGLQVAEGIRGRNH